MRGKRAMMSDAVLIDIGITDSHPSRIICL